MIHPDWGSGQEKYYIVSIREIHEKYSQYYSLHPLFKFISLHEIIEIIARIPADEFSETAFWESIFDELKILNVNEGSLNVDYDTLDLMISNMISDLDEHFEKLFPKTEIPGQLVFVQWLKDFSGMIMTEAQ